MLKLFLSALIVLTMSFSCTRKAEKEKFLIPKDYRGRVVVFFDQKKGFKKEYIDKARIYRIPANGILLTQFSENPGIQSVDKNEIAFAFYDDSTKQEKNIPMKPLNADPKKVYVFNGSTGKINDYPYYECIIDKQENVQNYFVKNAQGTDVEPNDTWDKILRTAGLNDK
jgi:hypothetical protein